MSRYEEKLVFNDVEASWQKFLDHHDLRDDGILTFTAVLGFTWTLRREFGDFFKDPSIPISVGCWFVLGAMDLAWPVQDSVELARSAFVPFKGLLFMPGFRFGEPRVDHNAFSVASGIFIHVLVFIALGFSLSVACFRGARLAVVRTAGEPTILSRTEASHQ